MISGVKPLWKNGNNSDIFKMEVLKIATAGSVDDGKSTLIGRLLFETQSIPVDRLAEIEERSKAKGYDYLDFSLATDGLLAEREQGITIDVAHIYFSTSSRNYILADTPGHEEYTRNMLTGASTAHLSIILVDARKGIVPQTRRHFAINQLLRIPKVIVAVNKMDLVDYREEAYRQICSDFEEMLQLSDYPEQKLEIIPVSALQGDHITGPSQRMNWYTGQSVLDVLECYDYTERDDRLLRFPVQTVLRPKKEGYHDYRAYAGRMLGGRMHKGQTVQILPSGLQGQVKALYRGAEEVDEVLSGDSISVELEGDYQLSRGDWLVHSDEQKMGTKNLMLHCCWMERTPLTSGEKLWMQHGTQLVQVKVKRLIQKWNLSTGWSEDHGPLQLNEIGSIELLCSKDVFADPYEDYPENGSVILISPRTNQTVAAGIVQNPVLAEVF